MNLIQKIEESANALRVRAKTSAFPEILRAKAEGLEESIKLIKDHVEDKHFWIEDDNGAYTVVDLEDFVGESI